jgi:hypothetical protein
MSEPPSNDPEHQILPFPAQGRAGSGPTSQRSSTSDNAAGRRDEDSDDYRHRMITNLVGLTIVVLLVAAGVWLADTMASMRKNQDCVLSGRRNCSPVEAPPARW